MIEPAHVVAIGGALGALARYGVYRTVVVGDLPAATFLVNVLGSFVLGLLLFWGVGETTWQLLAIGFCGAFTTFSSFAVETVQLFERGDHALAFGTAVANLGGALVAIGLAWLVLLPL